ncbi:MAG: hypothetical protein ABIQ93_09980 [Saprospiraceae bacterium]
MKKILAWTLLVIYLNAAAQALLPWVSDVMAHAFNWQDHLEHVHNGQVHSHHVGLAMAATEQDNAEHPVTTPSFSYIKDALSAHLVPMPPAVWGVTQPVRIVPFADWSFLYQNVAGDVLLPPPDALQG